jgi:hypothetical protein
VSKVVDRGMYDVLRMHADISGSFLTYQALVNILSLIDKFKHIKVIFTYYKILVILKLLNLNS